VQTLRNRAPAGPRGAVRVHGDEAPQLRRQGQSVVDAPELGGQVAIVTGGARAIGRAIAEALGRRGATVVSIDLAASDETVAAIADAGGWAVSLAGDVTEETAVDAAFAEVLDRYGRIDALVNNAGLFAGIERRPFWEIDLPEWEHVLGVNVRSVFLCSRAAAAPMRAAGRGR